MDIQTETITTMTTIYRFQLTDAEVGEILADPTKFQAQLRALRAEQNRGRRGRKNIRLGARQGPKAKAAKSGLVCPHCGKAGLSKMGLGVHLARMHKDQPAPAAGS